jgi:thioester reductase-like protein
MQYFVTGATGFIGKRLVKTLLARRGTTVHFLVRPGSEGKLADLLHLLGRGARPARLPVTAT